MRDNARPAVLFAITLLKMRRRLLACDLLNTKPMQAQIERNQEMLVDLLTIRRVQPMHVAAYIEQLQGERSAPTVKQHLACIRMLFDWLAPGGRCPPILRTSSGDHVTRSAKRSASVQNRADRLAQFPASRFARDSAAQ
jgi:hypothetical protein